MTRRRTPISLVLACALACASDEGTLDDGPESGSESAGESGESGELDECDARPFDPGPAPLRRLSARQYANTVRDLFPGVALPEPTILVDPKVGGFEHDAAAQTPSALLIEQYQRAAVEITAAAMQQSEAWLPCPLDGGEDAAACGEALILELGPRAFRRPLDAATAQVYLDFFAAQLEAEGFRVALELTVQAMLQAPQFIYFIEDVAADADPSARIQPLDDYSLATRLSYFVWNTMPDAELFAAAATGELRDDAGLTAQVERMLADPRARTATVEFFRQWFDFDRLDTIVPDPASYPSYTPALRDAMREELERFVAWLVHDERGGVDELLRSDRGFVDAELAALYGVASPSEPWQPVTLDASERAGILTRAGFLAARAHAVQPSPVKRGVFVLEHLLCAPPPPPPPNVDTSVPDNDPAQPKTNRERYAAHTDEALCVACHADIDPIGFGFEHYDSLGAWRTHDGGWPVDASGTLTLDAVELAFDGVPQLAALLADSERVHACVVTHHLRWALARSPASADACSQAALEATFADGEGSLRELVVAIVLSDAFRLRARPL